MSWYRTLFVVLTWIVLLAPILPIPPLANFPFSNSPSLYTTESSTAFLFSLDSILGSLSFGRHLTPLDNPPNPLPSFSVVAPSLGPDEALYVLRGAKAPALSSRTNPARKALRRMRLRFIAPVLDTIIRPSTTSTAKVDMAPTQTWTRTNPGQPRAAHDWAPGRICTYEHDSDPASTAFPSIYDVGKLLRDRISLVAAHGLVIGRVVFDSAERVVTFAMDPSDELDSLLSALEALVSSVLDKMPRSIEELRSTSDSLARAAPVVASQALSRAEVLVKDGSRRLATYLAGVVDRLPTWKQISSAVCGSLLASFSVARDAASDAFTVVVTLATDYRRWASAFKVFFLYYYLPFILVIRSVYRGSLLLLQILDRRGLSPEQLLYRRMGVDPRSIIQDLTPLFDTRRWNVMQLVMDFVEYQTWQSKAQRWRYEPAPSEDDDWMYEDARLGGVLNGGTHAPVGVPALLARAESVAEVEA